MYDNGRELMIDPISVTAIIRDESLRQSPSSGKHLQAPEMDFLQLQLQGFKLFIMRQIQLGVLDPPSLGIGQIFRGD